MPVLTYDQAHEQLKQDDSLFQNRVVWIAYTESTTKTFETKEEALQFGDMVSPKQQRFCSVKPEDSFDLICKRVISSLLNTYSIKQVQFHLLLAFVRRNSRCKLTTKQRDFENEIESVVDLLRTMKEFNKLSKEFV